MRGCVCSPPPARTAHPRPSCAAGRYFDRAGECFRKAVDLEPANDTYRRALEMSGKAPQVRRPRWPQPRTARSGPPLGVCVPSSAGQARGAAHPHRGGQAGPRPPALRFDKGCTAHEGRGVRAEALAQQLARACACSQRRALCSAMAPAPTTTHTHAHTHAPTPSAPPPLPNRRRCSSCLGCLHLSLYPPPPQHIPLARPARSPSCSCTQSCRGSCRRQAQRSRRRARLSHAQQASRCEACSASSRLAWPPRTSCRLLSGKSPASGQPNRDGPHLGPQPECLPPPTPRWPQKPSASSDFWYDVAGWACLVGIVFGVAALSRTAAASGPAA